MTLRPCLQCGEPSDRSRCPAHRPRCTKPSRQSRGYDAHWQRLSAKARRLQPWCTDCGATDDLQLDHLPSAWERKARGLRIRLGVDAEVVCGPCNRARGQARGMDPSATRQHPMVKAESELHTPGGYP